MLREFTKTSIAIGAHCSGLTRLLGNRRWRVQRLPLVVSYHRVVQDFEASGRHAIAPMLTSAATFERHLDWIGRHYEFATLDEVSEAMALGQPGPRPLAAVTFDDGYRDVYSHAYPILKRKGIPSAVFVVSDVVGTSHLQIHDEIYLLLSKFMALCSDGTEALLGDVTGRIPGQRATLPSEPFALTRVLLENLNQDELVEVIRLMRTRVPVTREETEGLMSLTWDMLGEMSAHDVTIGSHTKSHALLTNEPAHKASEEIIRSREDLSDRLADRIDYFAYPDGRFDAQTVEWVREAGYRAAFTTCVHRDVHYPHLTVPRLVLWERACHDCLDAFSGPIMSCLANGIFDHTKCKVEHD